MTKVHKFILPSVQLALAICENILVPYFLLYREKEICQATLNKTNAFILRRHCIDQQKRLGFVPAEMRWFRRCGDEPLRRKGSAA